MQRSRALPKEKRKNHLIKELDKEKNRGVCVICGPTRVFNQGGSYRCEVPYRRAKNKNTMRNRFLNYGMTEDYFNATYAAQGGKCAICRRELTSIHADHDHGTGSPRGLLCGNCNRGLGIFKDSPARLRRAAKYLERYER